MFNLRIYDVDSSRLVGVVPFPTYESAYFAMLYFRAEGVLAEL
jgi:hypothetical protein